MGDVVLLVSFVLAAIMLLAQVKLFSIAKTALEIRDELRTLNSHKQGDAAPLDSSRQPVTLFGKTV